MRKLEDYKEEHQNFSRILNEAKSDAPGINSQLPNRSNMPFSLPGANHPLTLPPPPGEFQDREMNEEERSEEHQ